MQPNLVKGRFSERSDPGEFEGERPLIHTISGTKRAARFAALFVPRTRLELVQTLRSKGFSYHYGLRHHLCLWSGLFLHREAISSLGVSCLVSAPSSFQRLGSRLPSALPVKVSLNLRHSTTPLSGSALKLCLSPSCLPFHHQGSWGYKDNQLNRIYKKRDRIRLNTVPF